MYCPMMAVFPIPYQQAIRETTYLPRYSMNAGLLVDLQGSPGNIPALHTIKIHNDECGKGVHA